MKRIGLACAAVCLALVTESLAQAPANAPPPHRVALLVGINEYLKPGFTKLNWSENDVDELAVELRRLGFEKVVVMKGSASGALNPRNAEAIKAQLLKLLEPLTDNDLVLVALSGHGQQITLERNGQRIDDDFYCPVAAVDGDPATMLSISELTDDILRPRVGLKLLLIDACRDNTREKRLKSVRAKGIQGRVLALPQNTSILFSCSSGQQSQERDDLKHSVFSKSVLEALQAGNLTWTSVIHFVEDRVPALNPDQEVISTGSIKRVVLGRRALAPAIEPKKSVAPTRSTPGTLAAEGKTAGEERDDNALKLKLCWCPKGSFRMGSPPGEPDRDTDEGPVNVTLSRGFWLGKFEVTQAQWQTVMGSTIEEQMEKSELTIKILGLRGKGPDHPMYCVYQPEAEEFCRKLTASERGAGRLSSDWEYRLPTEAQWEYACRAGTTTATAFGDRLSSGGANFNGNNPYNGAAKGPYIEKTTPVGHYRPNAWGLSDMHGNVWEWCRDGYAEQLAGGTDPLGPSGASNRVIRGGGWIDDGRDCRSADRLRVAPDNRIFSLGFRIARVSSQ